MQRWFVAILFLFASCLIGGSSGVGGEKKKTGGEKKAGAVTIEYHGQSFYILTTSNGTRIAFDPHTIPAYHPSGRVTQQKADIVCISHNHNDHTRLEAIEMNKKVKVVRGLRSPSLKADWASINEKIGDVKIYTVGVYHDNAEGLMRGKNAIFIVEADGWRFGHLGDLGHYLSPAQLRKIGALDVVMIPVGGIYTLNGSEAKKVIAQLKPKEYIFPMHYGTKVFEDVLPVDEFLEDQDKRKIAISDDNIIKLSRDAQRPRPLIVQLNYWPKAMQAEEKKKEGK